ncbi:hypothetical protein [Kribbella ginsengisoli]|uniref:Uncharacterized protein n=1 Tax=Kribbella ginsengisoli TaxID=363865 RepID=A0ABP6WUK6_9ACTN
MNLDDLRTQLHQQAGEIDPATPVPLPAIRRRRKVLKRQRAATILTTAAAAVAVIATVLPGAIDTSTPDPAKPPPDVTRNGITIPGTVGADRLDKAEIAEPGADSLEFSWTPGSTDLTFRSYCRAEAEGQLVRVTVDTHVVLDQPCDDTGDSPRHASAVPSDHLLWLQAKPGKATRVQVFVVDRSTGKESPSVAGLAIGIYRSTAQPVDPAVAGLPVRVPPVGPGDYVKDGFRFPAKTATDTLVSAAVSDFGEETLTRRFKAPSAGIRLRTFCAAEMVSGQFTLKIIINGKPLTSYRCTAKQPVVFQQAGSDFSVVWPQNGYLEVTLQVVQTATGKPFAGAPLHIGFGAYALGSIQALTGQGGTALIDQVIEYGGYRYLRTDARTVAAAGGDELTIDTPADKPYVIAYGIAARGPTPGQAPIQAKLLGLANDPSVQLGGGTANVGPGFLTQTYGAPAGPAGKVTLKIVDGRPTKGMLYLAIYLPE